MNKIFSFHKPRPSPSSITKPTCSSYTKAYTVCFLKRLSLSMAVLFLFALSMTLLSQFLLSYTVYFSWRSFFYSVLLWLSLQSILITRLAASTFHRQVQPNLLYDITNTLLQPNHMILHTFFTVSSLTLLFSYFMLVLQTTIPMDIPAQGHGAQQISLVKLFIFVYGCLLGLSYSVFRIFNQVWIIRLQVVQQHPLYLIKSYTVSLKLLSFLWSLGIFVFAYVSFILFSNAYYGLATRFIGLFSTVLDTPIIKFRWWDVPLFFKMVIVGTLIIKSWTFADQTVHACFDRVEDCVSPYSNAFDCLIDGLQFRKSDRIRGLAFAELARIASKDQQLRKALYSDDNTANSTWQRVKTECLTAINDFTTKMKTGYQLPASSTTKPVMTSSTVTPVTGSYKKSVKLVEDNVFVKRSVKKTSLDDRTMKVITRVSSQLSNKVPSPDIHVGKLTKAVISKCCPSDLFKPTRSNGWITRNLIRLIQENRKLYISLGDTSVCIWSIQALASLTMFSLQEDDLGLVKYDLSNIVNKLLECLITVENYISSPPSQPSEDLPLLQPYQLKLALDTAVMQIKLAFKDSLDDIHIEDNFLLKWNQI